MQATIRRFAAQGAMCARRAAAYAALCVMLAAPALAQTYQGQGGYQGQGDYQGGQGGYQQGQGGDYPGQQGDYQGQGAYQGQGGGYSQGQAGGGNNRCQELERQLVSDWQSGQMPQDAVVRLDQQLEQLIRDRRRLEGEAERRECYEELFIFGRSLKRTPACIQIDGDLERMRRDIANLRQQRDGMTNSAKRRVRREDLVAELARNGCGENYQREASTQQRRRAPSFFSLWEDDSVPFDRGYANTQPEQSNLPFASYRTMCVRLCDGFYFPISFSTLGSRFAEDEAKCKSQCAAPAELFVYKNPGEEIEQAVSLTGSPYTGMKNAFRNRKEFVKGCSCRQEEYSTQQIEQYEQEKGRKQASAPAAAPAQQ